MVKDTSPSTRGGAALVLVVLLVLALTVMGHGLLVLATSEAGSSASGGVAVAERLVVRAALHAAVERLVSGDSLPRLAVGDRSILPVSPGRVEVEGASAEVVLVEARAAEDRDRSLVAAVWGLDAVIRAAAREAVAEAGGPVSAAVGAIGAGGFWDHSVDPTCAALGVRMDSLRAARGLPRPEGRLSGGAPDGMPIPPSAAARTLGLLGPDSLAARLALLPPGLVTPTPTTVGGTCTLQPFNWGSPNEPEGPCGDRRVGFQVPGSLEVRGGEGQGLLLVEGDLSLQGETLFAGLVLVGGDLTLSGGATLRGAARAGGNIRVEGESTIVGAACPVALALGSLPQLLRPLRVREPPALLH